MAGEVESSSAREVTAEKVLKKKTAKMRSRNEKLDFFNDSQIDPTASIAIDCRIHVAISFISPISEQVPFPHVAGHVDYEVFEGSVVVFAEPWQALQLQSPGLGLCSEVLNTRWKEVFVSKMIGADSMTGLMNLRSLKNFVLLQSVHWQGTEGPKNEMSLGLFELDF
ncbi:hypothetical protein NA56DRAFT_655260 [Hyaloscypha hepaticicola]|uniref:Uncharacterized protein n=1 Tax=Hyaloscypha hepaticicola TaxID=2082293 RepID=A0A2J6QHU7_9HELO|nr:hypothetical protein NA56DRAFT_655260 [Hyaloscypha hepaticicola]